MTRNFVTEYTTATGRGTVKLYHHFLVDLETLRRMFPWEHITEIVRQYRVEN